MKKVFLILATLFAVIAVNAQTAQQNLYQSFVNVTGVSERDVTPDRIYISITLDQSATNGKVSIEKLQKEMTTALTKAGIDVSKYLQAGAMTGDLKNYVIKKDQVINTKNFTLEVSSAAQAGKVFEALSKININQMSITKATSSKLEQIKTEMRTEAMVNAQKIAQTLAEAVGQKIGKAFYIFDNNFAQGSTNYYNNGPRMMLAAKSTAAESAEPELEFQDLKLRYTVEVKFVLE